MDLLFEIRMTIKVTISIRITIEIAETALRPNLTPLICLFSQMILVGSVAGVNLGAVLPTTSIGSNSSPGFFAFSLPSGFKRDL